MYHGFNVDSSNIVDTVDKLSVSEFVALLKHSYAIVTNDSSPIHIGAVKGSMAKIAYISLYKGSAYLNHYRVNEEGKVELVWRMRNFAKVEHAMTLLDPVKRLNAHSTLTQSLILESLPHEDEIVEWIIKGCERRLE